MREEMEMQYAQLLSQQLHDSNQQLKINIANKVHEVQQKMLQVGDTTLLMSELEEMKQVLA